MMVSQLQDKPSSATSNALAQFETQFIYPLGKEGTFHISHGENYGLFFKTQGESACFLAKEDGRIVGTISTALRPLIYPDGTGHDVLYIGDLKVSAIATRGYVLRRLARAVQKWAAPRSAVAFSVIMDGTERTPESYTGRVDIPDFRVVGQVVVLKISTDNAKKADFNTTTHERGMACFQKLSMGRYAVPVGRSLERSQMNPQWFINSDESASGQLEDTRKAKRLIDENNKEMKFAHLSCFAYRTVIDGVSLLSSLLGHCSNLDIPYLFTAIPNVDLQKFKRSLNEYEMIEAPATIYGKGLAANALWNINTSEV